ncbi:MAG: 5'/3'-nucleotidase SurE [Vicinamibacterales bacterium]
MRIRVALVAVCLGLAVAWPGAQTPYRILLTNDDGVAAPGLQAMAEALRALGDVQIIAPAENQSARGTALTTADPIHRLDITLPNGLAAIGLTATPATTVRVAVTKIAVQRPDLVVSGINNGVNTGLAAYISGTVAAAREAASMGIPAIASSLAFRAAKDVVSFRAAAEATVRVARIVRTQGLPKGIFLGVNVPEGTMATYKGIRATRQGTSLGVVESYDERLSPRTGKPYYWNRLVEAGATDVEGTDTWAVGQGYVAVTPYRVGEFDQATFDTLQGALK